VALLVAALTVGYPFEDFLYPSSSRYFRTWLERSLSIAIWFSISNPPINSADKLGAAVDVYVIRSVIAGIGLKNITAALFSTHTTR
jgi:hypothetical protein